MAEAVTIALRPPLTEKWGWFVALGVALIMSGGIAFGNVMAATVASVYTLGMIMLVSGVLHLMQAFRVKKWESVFYWMLSGSCYTVAGVFAFLNPMLASAALMMMMAVALIIAGTFRILTALTLRPLAGWGWIALGGVVTLLAGVVIAAGWPVNSLWMIGLFLAVDLVMQGLALVAFGVLAKR